MQNSIKQLKELTPYAKTLKVLYVEDNVHARMQTLKMFGNLFTDITVAVDGQDALEKFSQNTTVYDLIFSDINMPNMNGIKLLEEIRKVDKNIPFIIVSAHNETEHFFNSIRLGVDGYLLKPIDLKQYIELAVKTLLKMKNVSDNKRYKQQLESMNHALEVQVKERTQQLEEKLYIDDLTGIASRYAFLEELGNCGDKQIPIIFLLNIDSFRMYNELYGSVVGNEILVAFTQLLTGFVQSRGFALYRISGDEFVLYEVADYMDIERYEMTINALFDHLVENKIYIPLIDDEIELSVTIGVSFSRQNPLGKADMALHDAKQNGKKYTIHNMHIDTTKQLEKILYWKKEIKQALQEDRVIPYFQPIVDREQKIIKYEALMRIKQYDENDQVKIISPYHFLDIAKQTKQYNALSYRVIQSAIESIQGHNVSLSINLDMQDIDNQNFIQMLKEYIVKFNQENGSNQSPEKHIVLEILENDQIKDYTSFSQKLKQFKDINALIAIDDFGSGYSNLSHIIGLSPDYLKLDATLIQDIVKDDHAQKIVESVVTFAKSLGIKTIAEYVANKEIFEMVYKIGVDEFQGYYFSPPIPIEALEELELACC